MRGSYFTALFFSFIALVLLIFINIGVTFNSSFLNDLYIVKATKADNSLSVRYGPYNSCLLDMKSNNYNCTIPALMYDIDLDRLVQLTGAESVQMLQFQMDMSKQLALHKSSVIVLPIGVFAFITFCCKLHFFLKSIYTISIRDFYLLFHFLILF
ncbi:hypothetical protein BJ944DRAFT_263845 [Cunninghamella echinulata]|nr:hypothetical protein BJ944DRAFT_263845 [Cunninghamella echinulata]